MTADIKNHMETKMDQSIAAFKNNLQRIRTGRPSPAILDTIHVDYYGSMVPLSQVANVQLLDARTLAAIPLGNPRLGRQIGIVTRTGRSLSPAAQAFIEQLKASASGLAPAGEAPSSGT